LDVAKALFQFVNVIVMSTVMYPLLPDATRYAMGALKHSLHNCYFCYRHETATVGVEIAFFEARLESQPDPAGFTGAEATLSTFVRVRPPVPARAPAVTLAHRDGE